MNLCRAGLAASVLALAASGGTTSAAESPSSADSTISAASAAPVVAPVFKAALPAATAAASAATAAAASPNGTIIESANVTDTDIVAVSSGQCSTVSAYSTTAGAAIVQSPCAGVSEQLWTLKPVGNYYHIVSVGSGLCLNVSNGSTAKGDPMIQWPCQTNGATNDQWSIVAVSGYYEIVSAYDGQCLNVDGSSQAAGAALIQWPCTTSANNDLWILSEPTKQVQIRDSSGNVWTVVSGVVYENGAEAGHSLDVTLLLYDNNSLYYQNSAGSWYFWNGSGWIASSDPRKTHSPDGATVPAATQITDSSGNVWAIVGGVAYWNGVATESANVALLLYDNNSVYADSTIGSWYIWNGSTWKTSSDPRAKASANGTTVPAAPQITDSSHNVWTIVGGIVYENGAEAGYTRKVTELLYYSGRIYGETSAGKWYYWNGSDWIASVDPETGGTATLSWDAPTENTNGTPLRDLAGYTIFYGNSSAALTTSIEVADPTATKYVVSNLNPGTYYFAVAADASDGTQSKKSLVGSKTIP
jgi:hypothetical protein